MSGITLQNSGLAGRYFDSLVKNTELLRDSDNLPQSLSQLEKIQKNVEELIRLIKKNEEEKARELTSEKTNIFINEQKVSLLSEKLKAEKRKLEGYNAGCEEARIQEYALYQKINDLSQIISENEEEKSRNETKKGAGIGMIVGGSLLTPIGIGIPFLVAGSIMTSNAIKEIDSIKAEIKICLREQEDTHTEIQTLQGYIDNCNVYIKDIKNNIFRLRLETNELDEKVKKLGRELTNIHLFRTSLHSLCTQFTYLNSEIVDLREWLQVDFQDSSAISEFYQAVKKIGSSPHFTYAIRPRETRIEKVREQVTAGTLIYELIMRIYLPTPPK